MEDLSDTALTEYDQFDDYLEMVIQFGVGMIYRTIITLCVAVCNFFFRIFFLPLVQ